MNLGASLLGPLYDLYVAALGQSVGEAVSYLTLVALAALGWWLVTNRQGIISGLDLRGAVIWEWMKILIVAVLLYFVTIETLGFPPIGALTVAVCITWLYNWTMTSLEGEPV